MVLYWNDNFVVTDQMQFLVHLSNYQPRGNDIHVMYVAEVTVQSLFVMVPLNMTYLHCLQHSLFEHLFNLYFELPHKNVRDQTTDKAVCFLCDKRFSSVTAIKTHQRVIHMEHYPHPCNNCPRVSFQKIFKKSYESTSWQWELDELSKLL